jgi:hypothetical protein
MVVLVDTFNIHTYPPSYGWGQYILTVVDRGHDFGRGRAGAGVHDFGRGRGLVEHWYYVMLSDVI